MNFDYHDQQLLKVERSGDRVYILLTIDIEDYNIHRVCHAREFIFDAHGVLDKFNNYTSTEVIDSWLQRNFENGCSCYTVLDPKEINMIKLLTM